MDYGQYKSRQTITTVARVGRNSIYMYVAEGSAMARFCVRDSESAEIQRDSGRFPCDSIGFVGFHRILPDSILIPFNSVSFWLGYFLRLGGGGGGVKTVKLQQLLFLFLHFSLRTCFFPYTIVLYLYTIMYRHCFR